MGLIFLFLYTKWYDQKVTGVIYHLYP